MITEERLREMIKNNEKIYLCSTNTGSETTCSTSFNNYGALDFCVMLLFNLSNTTIYESKEECEFAQNFKNIERKEILSLPTWEELNKDLDKRMGDFWIADNNYIAFIYDKRDFNLQLILKTKDEKYNWIATKENYIEACILAKKLSLGE